jgi:tRNA pseudouridine38-40 synthase
MRIALGIEYLGTNYFGWQWQEEVISVQECLEDSLAKIAQHKIRVSCSGRTDKGVHAKCQVVHFDTEVDRDMRAWVYGTNRHLPKDIKVLWAKNVSNDFHARFSTKRRHYQYLIYEREVRSAIYGNLANCHYKPLDIEKMRKASEFLIGEHDFSSFRASGCQAKSPIRCIYYLNINRHGEFIEIDISANGFLHHMVRNIMGVLIPIGNGQKEISWAKEVLNEKDRKCAGTTEDAAGLYFVRADYDESFGLPV